MSVEGVGGKTGRQNTNYIFLICKVSASFQLHLDLSGFLRGPLWFVSEK